MSMLLHELENSKGSVSKRKRLGRGPGSGLGKTCGKGHKGQKARAGGSVRRGFEGGQTPLYRRLPKFGFINNLRPSYQLINVSQLEACSAIGNSAILTKEILYSLSIIRKISSPIKLLGNGDLSKCFTIEVDAASNSAVRKVESLGGHVKVI